MADWREFIIYGSNGASPFSIQNLSEARYVDQIDDLLFLFQQAQVPLDCLPDLIPQGSFELVKILREPLRSQDQWADWIRQEVRYGATISDFAHTTVVIPLYRLWHSFMQGHLAAFSMDPSFLDARVEVMYVVDEPAIEQQIFNWAVIYMIALIPFELSALFIISASEWLAILV